MSVTLTIQFLTVSKEPIQVEYSGDLEPETQLPHGYGKMTFPDGETYQGEFCKGVTQGQGVYIDQEGNRYMGDFNSNGEMHGLGHWNYSYGDEFEGNFSHGQKHGYGRFKSVDGREYTGMYKQNSRHGHGVLKYPNGDYYEGNFKHNTQTGQGKKVNSYSTGMVMKGQFTKGKLEGWGVSTYSDGTTTYTDTGLYSKNKLNGEGSRLCVGGNIKTLYEGEFRNGLKEGKGSQKCQNGPSYEGNYLTDQFHGQGQLKDTAGNYKEGEFKQGQFWTGEAKLMNSSNQVVMEKWEEGHLISSQICKLESLVSKVKNYVGMAPGKRMRLS
jgi:hypothetical protein